MKTWIALVGIMTLSLLGCAKEEGPMEKMGKQIDEAAESVEKSAEEAAEKVREATEE